MYDHLYFDLDDTLVKDDLLTGKSELLDSGFAKYTELIKNSPKALKILLTNRESSEIIFPKVYSFDEIVGKDDMELYISNHLHKINRIILFSPKNLIIFFRGKYLHTRGQNPKLLYIFLRSLSANKKIHVLDDDRRISGMFGE